MLQPQSVTRREIKNLIRTYERRASPPDKGWYQNIRFMPFLETRRSVLDVLSARIRGVIRKEDLLISHLPPLEGRRVIDIGCNAGLYSLEASCRGASFVLGVDISQFRIDQANDVAGMFRRLGRPLGAVEFRRIGGINDHLDLIADKDVLIACCVLYHVGPLTQLKAAIVNSNITTLVLQGNLSRCKPKRLTSKKPPTGFGEDVASLEGILRFVESMGFTPSTVVKHSYPLVVAKR